MFFDVTSPEETAFFRGRECYRGFESHPLRHPLKPTGTAKNGGFVQAFVRNNLVFVAVSNSPDDPLTGGSRIQLRARALLLVQEANAARITLSKCSRL
jgi:hypothetical protein